MKATPAFGTVCLAVVLVGLFVFSGFPVQAGTEGTKGEPIILIVGGQDKMKTRNPLPALANDVWTSDVLGRVYDSIGQAMPDTEELVPYIIKGVDANENGQFDANEYGVFKKNSGTNPLNVTAYYDFNGVYFHDGVQASPGDLYFSYQLQALNPRSNIDLRVLMDKAGKSGSNYTTTRWLFMYPTAKIWINEPTVGNANLRIAVKFLLQEPFANFYRSTLTGYTLYPRHVWEGTGYREDTSSSGCSVSAPCTIPGLHTDFGLAIYPESDARFGWGIPTTETTFTPYVYLNSGTSAADSAEEWQMTDADVIGTGPFRFASFDEQQAVALVLKNPYFFTGKDEKTGQMIDSFVASYIHQPYIDGIVTNVYATATLGMLALKTGKIDFYHWSLAPEFVPELLNKAEIRIWSRPEPGFFYLAYNMRRPAIGTWHWGQADQFDIGYHFRKAVAHLIDKPTIVKNFLQGYGVPGVVPLNPSNIRFYNTSILGYDFSRTEAENELALAHQDALWLSTHGEPAAANWYTKDPGTGKYILPNIGTNQFILWCPNADYDPVRANSCTMIATEMQNIGINVVARPSAFSAITALINAHDFDMYILGWRIGGNDPDYFYSFFHSSNAALGQNYGGFNDPTLDWILEESRKELNEARRVELFKWAESILADKLPYDVLYFRTNIEAQRQDRFVGWMPASGTIWNYWSLLNIHPPSNKRLSVGVTVPSAVASDDTATVTVDVKDQDGNLLDGANVTLELAPAVAGNFTWGSNVNMTYKAQTSLGRVQVTYEAPHVSVIRNATLSASVTYKDPVSGEVYPEVGKSKLITVYPAGVNFLAVTISLLDTDVVNAGDSIRFGVAVTTPQGFTKDDAATNATIDGSFDPGYGLSPTNGTADSMTQITFRAPPPSALGYDENPYTITVSATSPGYFTGRSSASIVAVRLHKTCPNGEQVLSDQDCPKSVPGPDAVTILAVLGTVAVIYAVVRKRKA